jgi:putative nucleotidyltransferase with HDIG domain
MIRWVALPASKRHHHSYPGGLLAHSLECAFIAEQNVGMLTELSTREKEVTILAALLHDIGKTQTLSMDGHTSTGRLIDHELLTLQVLAKPLEVLKKRWPDGAQTLQYLLTWKSSMGFCKFVGGNIIKFADQISTSASLRRMAFQDKPLHYRYASIQKSNYSAYLNRLI